MTAATELQDVADKVARFPSDAVRHVVTELRRVIDAELRRDTGGDARMSGVGQTRLAVQTDIKGAVGSVTAGPKRMRGPWRWLEDGTRPRQQGNGRHPGTTAKRTWSEPSELRIPQIERELGTRFESAISR